MLRLLFIALPMALGCSSKGSTTVGDCPDGLTLDAQGSCVESEASVNDDTATPTTDPDEEEPESDPCTVEVVSTTPGDGEDDVYWRDALVFQLDGPDETATVTVSDSEGDALNGTLDNADGLLVWTATDGLVPDAEHIATLTWCGGETAIEFATSSLGSPLESDVDGNTYALDLGSATLVKPTGLDMFLGDALDIQLLVGVEVTGTELDFIGALTDATTLEQDECAPTFGFDRVDFSASPFFEAGPVDLPIEILDVSLTMWGMYLSGTFESDGAGMAEMGLEGALDIRELGPAFGDALGGLIDLSDPDSACSTVALFGVNCEECPSGDGDYCIGVDLEDIEAEKTDTTVTPIAAEDISEDCE